MTRAVFLSASVPLPSRDAKYFDTADVVAIRDSVRALATVVVPKGRLVFGGHPAITPLIRLLIRETGSNVNSHFVLFQSSFFKREFPKETEDFERVVVVAAVTGDREASLSKMRMEMIRSEDFSAGVFIGGMEGVEAEWNLFSEIHPNRPKFPIASTGAAARILYERFKVERPELLSELTYLSLFRRLLRL